MTSRRRRRLASRPFKRNSPRQAAEPDFAKLMSWPDVQQLVKLYFDIDDERLRKKVIEVTTILKKSDGE